MKGAIKKGWKKLLVLAMTCVFSASTMGGLYRSYSEARPLRRRQTANRWPCRR